MKEREKDERTREREGGMSRQKKKNVGVLDTAKTII